MFWLGIALVCIAGLDWIRYTGFVVFAVGAQ
jgi:hypothetical protein